MNTQLTEITPLILAGSGYQLTIAPEAEDRKSFLLVVASNVTGVSSNDESGDAQQVTRSLAAMRIEVEKSRKAVKEPINRIGKLIDATAANFLAEITDEENRIKRLIGDHATEQARLKAEKEAEERKAFEAARAAKEAAESGGIAAVIAAKKALADKLAASSEVAETRIADGVRFAWDFEVQDIQLFSDNRPNLVTIEPKRAAILAMIKEEAEKGFNVESTLLSIGIRAFKKPVVSSR